MDALIALAVAAATTTLAVPGRSNANVSLAAAGRFVVAVWSGALPAGATDIFAAVSRDGARSFSPPVRVNDVEGAASVSGEQPPRVAVVERAGRAPAIVVVWTARGQSGTRIVQARSDDEGHTFTRASAIPGADAAGNRGWQAIAASSGTIEAVWLDHRAMTSHEGHMSP